MKATLKLETENKRLKELLKNALEVIRKAGIDDYQIIELVEEAMKTGDVYLLSWLSELFKTRMKSELEIERILKDSRTIEPNKDLTE